MDTVNSDLRREREKATFQPRLLTHVLDGGAERTSRRKYIETLVTSDPDLQIKNFSYMTRDEMYDTGVRLNVLLLRKIRELNLTDQNDIDTYLETASPRQSMCFFLHDGMFMQTLQNQTTPEQKERWLKKAQNYEIIGTYAQTEMGHGTFLRGLETTAHYNKEKHVFILHSPTLTSTKWWPGNLGKSVNHAIVMAQLRIGEQNCGMQAFMVQLRSLQDHTAMPGVTLGDIGPKFGYGSNDNGFLSFDHVSVPITNMLMKNAQVLPDGTFVQAKNSKLSYGTMVFVRTLMLKDCAVGLAQCCTIATRYSAVRRQTELRPGYEPQVLYYQTQQYKLTPHLAASYAFWFVSDAMRELYYQTQTEIEKGQLHRLPELHGLSSGLKSFVTYAIAEGMEELRMSCGGHGYSHASGIPKLYAYLIPSCTYEGENTVLYLQCARYLMKAFETCRTGGNLAESIDYLKRQQGTKCQIREDLNLDALVNAYEHRASRQIGKAAKRIATLIGRGLNQQEAWNQTSIQLVKAAQAHSHAFVVKTFARRVHQMEPPSLKGVLTQLCQFYAANGILKNSGDFLQDGYMTDQQFDVIEERLLALLAELRVNAVALVDAFDFCDRFLDSALGRFDGNVYENLYKFALESPLNKTDVHPSYNKYIRPMIKANQTSKL